MLADPSVRSIETRVFDPLSGALLESFVPPRVAFGNIQVPPLHYGRKGERAFINRSEPDGTARRLVSLRSPGDYRFLTVHYSPDRTHLLVTDSEGRLLVGAANGSGLAVLTTVGRLASYPPLWFQDGNPEATVNLDDYRAGRPPSS